MQHLLIESIDASLPQTQCRKCGFAGCKPYAVAIARGEADINQCPPGGEEGILAPVLVTLLIGLIFTAPFVYVVIEGAREIRIVIRFLGEAQRNGVPVPDWIAQLPLVGRATA